MTQMADKRCKYEVAIMVEFAMEKMTLMHSRREIRDALVKRFDISANHALSIFKQAQDALVEELNYSRPQMVAKLIATLEYNLKIAQARSNQGAVVGLVRTLMDLTGINESARRATRIKVVQPGLNGD